MKNQQGAKFAPKLDSLGLMFLTGLLFLAYMLLVLVGTAASEKIVS